MDTAYRAISSSRFVARTESVAPSGPSETFEVLGRYGNVIATAETLDLAKRDVRYRIANLGQTGLTVQRVTVVRETVYRPRVLVALS